MERVSTILKQNVAPTGFGKTSGKPSDLELYYDGDDPEGSKDSLPPIDEIQYTFYVEEDEYSLVGLKDGVGKFTGLLPAGRLALIVGPMLADMIALGAGERVHNEFWDTNEFPFRSLPVHEKELNQMDKEWLASMME